MNIYADGHHITMKTINTWFPSQKSANLVVRTCLRKLTLVLEFLVPLKTFFVGGGEKKFCYVWQTYTLSSGEAYFMSGILVTVVYNTVKDRVSCI